MVKVFSARLTRLWSLIRPSKQRISVVKSDASLLHLLGARLALCYLRQSRLYATIALPAEIAGICVAASTLQDNGLSDKKERYGFV